MSGGGGECCGGGISLRWGGEHHGWARCGSVCVVLLVPYRPCSLSGFLQSNVGQTSLPCPVGDCQRTSLVQNSIGTNCTDRFARAHLHPLFSDWPSDIVFFSFSPGVCFATLTIIARLNSVWFSFHFFVCELVVDPWVLLACPFLFFFHLEQRLLTPNKSRRDTELGAWSWSFNRSLHRKE